MEILRRIILLLRTLSYLRPIQIRNRFSRNIFPIKINNENIPNLRQFENFDFIYITKPQSFISSNHFEFLNRAETLSFPEGWNDKEFPKLWLYNLHYFEGILNKDTSNDLKEAIIHQWIIENPVGYGNGWEPYPSSLRIVNWIKWHFSGGKLSINAIESLVLQSRYLFKNIEWHLLGNHLFANAKALLFSGLFFEGKEAEKWFHSGIEILKKQIPEQFLDDGGHFELSTTYHALLTEDLLDIIHIMRQADKAIPNDWIEAAKKAVDWQFKMTRPDGLPPLFNDAAYGITPSLEQILQFANTLGFKNNNNVLKGMTDLNESGYFRFNGDNYAFFGDAGQIGPSYIPGHAHCDIGNFELFAKGCPIIVDTGISTYDVSERRSLERSTVSHNTIQIDGKEQSEIWGAFRVARRAKILRRQIDEHSVKLIYAGFQRSNGKIERYIEFFENEIVIKDKLESDKKSISRIHFHPDVKVELVNDYVKVGSITIEIKNQKSLELKNYNYAPEFNTLIPSVFLEAVFIKELVTTIKI